MSEWYEGEAVGEGVFDGEVEGGEGREVEGGGATAVLEEGHIGMEEGGDDGGLTGIHPGSESGGGRGMKEGVDGGGKNAERTRGEEEEGEGEE